MYVDINGVNCTHKVPCGTWIYISAATSAIVTMGRVSE